MPLLFLIFVLLLLLAPLSLHRAGQAIVITEVVNAWNALDVFVIALVACLLEIQQFATFIVGNDLRQASITFKNLIIIFQAILVMN